MARLASGDRFLGENGTVEGQKTGPAGRLDDDQALAENDQTFADGEQTSADADQTSAESDQAAADDDQAASDRDLRQGGDPEVHDASKDVRDRSTQQREETTEARVSAAATRDFDALARDQTALARDRAAALRDAELAAREAAWAQDARVVGGADIVLRASENRKRAALDRSAAAEGRARAAADRRQAARDRERAARDRAEAQADREALLHQLAIAETDALTGARTRGAGLADVELELGRARRTSGKLVAAYVDVVGLKRVNDDRGHAAGDALLQRVVRALRAHLRPYDLIVRLGGDEFLCVLSGATVPDGRRRFEAVRASLCDDPDGGEIRVGFASLEPEDNVASLIARADGDLPAGRPRAHTSR